MICPLRFSSLPLVVTLAGQSWHDVSPASILWFTPKWQRSATEVRPMIAVATEENNRFLPVRHPPPVVELCAATWPPIVHEFRSHAPGRWLGTKRISRMSKIVNLLETRPTAPQLLQIPPQPLTASQRAPTARDFQPKMQWVMESYVQPSSGLWHSEVCNGWLPPPLEPG